jgi:hypothetical protein
MTRARATRGLAGLHATERRIVMGAEFRGESNMTADGRVVRGPQSWAYIYTVLGFVVTIASAGFAFVPVL